VREAREQEWEGGQERGLHVRGLGSDGATQVFGLGLAAEELRKLRDEVRHDGLRDEVRGAVPEGTESRA
jgi:hypothetical protein